MREQDVERIAAEVLAALREGAPAGADRPGRPGGYRGAALSRPPGGEASRKRRIPGCPRLRTRAGTGAVRFPIWRGRNSAGGVSSLHPIGVTSLMISFRTPGRASPPGLWGRRPPSAGLPAFPCGSCPLEGTVFKEVPEEWISGHGLWGVSTLAEDKDTYLTRPDLGGCCPRSRCGS